MYLPLTLYHYIPEIAKQKCCVSGRNVADTTLSDIGFNQIVTYQIPDILDTRYTGYQIVACLNNLQLKFKQNMYVFPLI